MKKQIFVFLSLITLKVYAEEFIYPLVKLDDTHIFVMHQKSLDDIQLFIWNTEHTIATKELSSLFLPSMVKVLPSKKGFSFIDRGRIRIKQFQKRAPKTIDILEPINSIISIEWISDAQFYIVAKYKKNYKVFVCELSDSTYQLFHATNLNDVDYLYPCKTDDFLFCIARHNQQYTVIQQSWHVTPYGKQRDIQHEQIIIESHKPLCFLHMKSAQEGYFLTSNSQYSQKENLLNFTCCHCKKIDGSWFVNELFSFNLPKSYIMGDSDNRVYESINPFLPNYDHPDYIFFTDYTTKDEYKSCMMYTYDKSQNCILENFVPKRSHLGQAGFLGTVVLENQIIFGLILQTPAHTRFLHEEPYSGIFQIDLPIIYTNLSPKNNDA